MKKITTPQIAKIHILMNKLGITDQKPEIVYNLTNGRSQSTRDLTLDEATRLIGGLCEFEPQQKQKRLIFSLAYKAGIIYGETPEDKKMNAAKLNMFLRERGAVKKELNAMSHTELIKVHRQFEAMAKSHEKAGENKLAKQAVNQLLNEINLAVK